VGCLRNVEAGRRVGGFGRRVKRSVEAGIVRQPSAASSTYTRGLVVIGKRWVEPGIGVSSCRRELVIFRAKRVKGLVAVSPSESWVVEAWRGYRRAGRQGLLFRPAGAISERGEGNPFVRS
jgi:hypothetical protein